MATVYAVIEYLPIGATGVGGEAVVSEHPTPEGAIAAKAALYAQRPELVGCLAIRSHEATLPVPVVVVPAVVAAPAEQKGEDGDAGAAAEGADGGGDGIRGQGAGSGHVPDVSALRPAGRGVRGHPVEPSLPGVSTPS